MGQVLQGSATTTEAIRRAIQHSQASLRTLAKRYGINQKTVAKWKKRTSAADLPTGPKEPRSGARRRDGQCRQAVPSAVTHTAPGTAGRTWSMGNQKRSRRLMKTYTGSLQIGRAHVCHTVTQAPHVC